MCCNSLTLLDFAKLSNVVLSESIGKLTSEVKAAKQITTTISNELVIMRTKPTQTTTPGQHSDFVKTQSTPKTVASKPGSKICHCLSKTTYKYYSLLGCILVRRIS